MDTEASTLVSKTFEAEGDTFSKTKAKYWKSKSEGYKL
jgi:hypothetical protein